MQQIEALLSPEEKEMIRLIKRCLIIDPNERMTCEEALTHPWFNDLINSREREIEIMMMSQKPEFTSSFIGHEGQFSPAY